MLQQTQVSRVTHSWKKFLDRFPTVADCAAAPVGDVIELWDGLGFNRRAVNLHKAAQQTVTRFDGELPRELTALRSLPGIGPYTSRAVMVFAFEEPVGVVDTNVGRLLARWVNGSLTATQAQQMADSLVPPDDAWRWNQSLFDFATAVCTKKSPACDACPLRDVCRWAGSGPDPAGSSAGVSKPQSTFEGSRRQVRGRLLSALREAPIARVDLASYGRPSDDDQTLESIVADLVHDELIVDHGAELRLPR